MRLNNFLRLAPHSENYSLMATLPVPAGEPQDIESELERVDFNEYLTGGADGVYVISVEGDSMEVKISHGDLLIVNRNLQPKPGETVVARVGAAYTVKIYSPCKNGLRLVAANDKYEPRFVNKKEDCEIFGVVTHVIHRLKKI